MLLTPAPAPGPGLETPGPLSLDLAPLTVGTDDAEPAVDGPSLVGGTPAVFSPLFFLPKRKDIVAP